MNVPEPDQGVAASYFQGVEIDIARAIFPRMAWCDRVAVAWWFLLFVVMETAWKGDHFILADRGIWYIFFLIVGIPWLALRCVDFIIGGPARRRAHKFMV